MERKHKVWCISNWQFSAFCLTTTKLTANEFYCYKIETLQFFTYTWFNYEPSSQHLHLFHEFFRFTVFNGHHTDHAKPLPDPE